MRIFLLEDDPERIAWFVKRFRPGSELVITRQVSLACRMLKEMEFDVIFLDHDLNDFDKPVVKSYHGYNEGNDLDTGYHVAEWLEAHPTSQLQATIIVHSVNDGGAVRMMSALQGRTAHRIPFPYLPDVVDRLLTGLRGG